MNQEWMGPASLGGREVELIQKQSEAKQLAVVGKSYGLDMEREREW